MDDTFDIAVVGGGIVGLAVARELLSRRPGARLVLLEKEAAVARHQTARSSGVVHSGIYYTPGSLKARTCVSGAAALARYCSERGIPLLRCGKVIVARDARELPRLEELHRRGVDNGVPGLELVGPERLREIEPHAAGVRALWSPQTGIVDFVRVSEALAADVRAASGVVRTGVEVTGIRPGAPAVLRTTGGEVRASLVVACAGLQSDRVAAMAGGDRDPRIVPFRGDYWVLRPERRSLVRGLVYPVPDPAFPFLGVHFTLRPDGEVWLGPTAVLTFAREGDRHRRFVPRDALAALGHPGLYRLGLRHFRTGLAEMVRSVRLGAVVAAARGMIPDLAPDDLAPGPSGTRAQALGRDGTLVDDFVLERRPGIVLLRNAPSPAGTAALAIAALVADAATAA